MSARLQIYKGHMIKRESSGFRAYFDHISKWFPSEIAAKHWINIKLQSHERTNH